VTIPLATVAAFAHHPRAGNLAGVCVLDREPRDDWMQSVASVMKHAETAFVWPSGDEFAITWFTPVCEVALCGHATLAAAHVLAARGRWQESLRFTTRSAGPLICLRNGEKYVLDFPQRPARAVVPPPGLEDALGTPYQWVGQNEDDLLVFVDSEETVRQLQPDLTSLAEIEVRGVIVTAQARDTDFVSRFFAPRFGVPEDDVTGSAHCALGPFWATALGKQEMVGYQASPRGGTVGVRLVGDRCHLLGHAVTCWQGEWLADSP